MERVLHSLRAWPPRHEQLQEVRNAHATAIDVAGTGTAPLSEKQLIVRPPHKTVAGLSHPHIMASGARGCKVPK